jgi:hypothetical protein
MKKFKLKLNEAYNFIKFQRYVSSPICYFLDELEEFEGNSYKFNDEIYCAYENVDIIK